MQEESVIKEIDVRKRERLGKYYTPEETIKQIIKKINFDKYDIVVEPSAGNGAWLNYLPKDKSIFLDLLPEHENVFQLDFFKFDINMAYLYNQNVQYNKGESKVLTIGNPPFGKNSSLAVDFFNKAAEFSETIAFILPKTFRKVSIKNRLSLDFHLKEEFEIDENFWLDDEKVFVPTIVQIWERKDKKRKKIKVRLKTELFDFVNQEEADIAIRRVGVYAGKCYTNVSNKSESSHYFIKLKDIDVKDFKTKTNNINWDHDNTLGPKSISKHELIEEVEKIEYKKEKRP